MSSKTKNLLRISFISAFALILCVHFISTNYFQPFIGESNSNKPLLEKKLSFSKKLPKEERKKGRDEYFNKLMRDPKTGMIPPQARIHELKWKNSSQNFKTTGDKFDWEQAGPFDVGGRTRAVVFDTKNSNTLIIGSVSGGIWKSIDRGSTWTLKTPDYQNMNVTSIAQDTRAGFEQTWYAVTGEFNGNSAGSPASGFRGYGIFKSVDNGETWSLLPSATNPNITTWNSAYDYMSKVAVNPVNGDVYVASHAGVLLKSTNAGTSWSTVLGEFGNFQYVDVVISNTGRVIASLSADGIDEDPAEPNSGIYYSDNNGIAWTSVTPNTFPSSYTRSALALAPSNQNILYVLTNSAGVSFFKINLFNGTFSDRSSFIPEFSGLTSERFAQQFNYNMVLSVKPDDENFVVIGALNLFRSANAFASKQFVESQPNASEISSFWIGGYSKANTNYALYSNHHPDQHAFVFDPANPNQAWSAHDGGFTFTNDIKASSVSWVNKNEGYYVTQFYHISISREKGYKAVIGGTQDNGSPLFEVGSEESSDASSGDGAYSFFGEKRLYASSQNGTLQRYTLNPSNSQFSYAGEITPENATDQLFIHPFAVDVLNEDIIYYPSSSTIYRTTDGGVNGVDSWTNVTSFKTNSSLTITALATSVQPANILYFGGSDDRSSPSSPPFIYKVTNANTGNSSSQLKELSLPGAAVGAYVSSIAVNPFDANEVLVTLSNYNIEGIFYSSDGSTFTQIEGNLQGSVSAPGSSIRSSAITNVKGEKVYVVGTTTGVYISTSIDGNNTTWIEEGKTTIGNSIVNALSYRESDTHIAVGTHGRGAFYGKASGDAQPIPDIVTLISPTNTDENVSVNTQFNWNASTNAQFYELEVSSNSFFSTGVIRQSNITTTNYTLSTSLKGLTQYFWRVRAVNATGKSVFSNISSFTTSAIAPLISFPTNLETNISISPILKWENISGISRYQVQLSSDIAFSTVEHDVLVDSASIRISNLTDNQNYFWRVRINQNDIISSWSEVFQFSTRPNPSITESPQVNIFFDFGLTSDGLTDPTQTDYRLVSLPSSSSTPINSIFKDKYGDTWRAYLENGAESNNYDEYSESDSRFQFKPGNGFWVLSTNEISQSFQVQSITPDENDNFSLAISAGWNVISNPFQRNIDWNLVQSLNGINANLWEYRKQFQRSFIMEAFKAYYFYNDPQKAKSVLLIPYSNGAKTGITAQQSSDFPEDAIRATISAHFSDNSTTEISWIFESKLENKTQHNRYHPDLAFVKNGLTLRENNETNKHFSQLQTEFNPEGNKFKLELKSTFDSFVKLSTNLNMLPSDAQILLVNTVTKAEYRLKTDNLIDIKMTEPTALFDVYIGSEQYLNEMKESLQPISFSLEQNYPNPFNPKTIIRYSITQESLVKLNVYDLMGRLVYTIVNTQQQPGWHTADFDASKLASGIYIYRLQAGNYSKTMKMLLVK